MSLYIRRVGVLLLIALPFATAVLALTGIVRGSATDAADAFTGAAILVYVWGAVTGSVVSLLHTWLTRRATYTTSIAGGVLLGVVGGALTPTIFTGFFVPAAIVLGGLTGLVYAIVIERLPGTSANSQRAK